MKSANRRVIITRGDFFIDNLFVIARENASVRATEAISTF
jgi:hypothetical protein